MAAYDFGTHAPLDGGGVFSLGAIYGAGIKFRVHPRIMINFDFRETWSQAPSSFPIATRENILGDQGFALQVFQVATE